MRSPKYLKKYISCRKALIAFDSQINTYTYVFMPFLHEMSFLRYLELLILCQSHPSYGIFIVVFGCISNGSYKIEIKDWLYFIFLIGGLM